MTVTHHESCYTIINFKKKSAATSETKITKANQHQKCSGYLKQLNKFFKSLLLL